MKKLSIVDFEKLNEQRGNQYLYWSFILQQNNAEEILSTDIQEPFRFEGIACCICLQGSALISIDLETFSLTPGTMIVALPSTIMNILQLSADFHGEVMAAGRQLLEEIELMSVIPYYHQIKRNPSVQLSTEQLDSIHEMTQLMDKKSRELTNPYRKEMVQRLMAATLLEICTQYRLSKPDKKEYQSHKEIIFKDFLNSLGVNCKSKHSIGFYAEEQCLTPKYFSAIIKEISGFTANEWIDKALILNAKVLLKNNDITIQQISDRLQFPNPSFFGQYFKKHTGMTPRQFRIQ